MSCQSLRLTYTIPSIEPFLMLKDSFLWTNFELSLPS